MWDVIPEHNVLSTLKGISMRRFKSDFFRRNGSNHCSKIWCCSREFKPSPPACEEKAIGMSYQNKTCTNILLIRFRPTVNLSIGLSVYTCISHYVTIYYSIRLLLNLLFLVTEDYLTTDYLLFTYILSYPYFCIF